MSSELFAVRGADYGGSLPSSMRGDTLAAASYTSNQSTDLRRLVPVDNNGIPLNGSVPVNIALMSDRQRIGAQLGSRSLRVSSMGEDLSARHSPGLRGSDPDSMNAGQRRMFNEAVPGLP